jgi:hypothetical protein
MEQNGMEQNRTGWNRTERDGTVNCTEQNRRRKILNTRVVD